MLGVVAAIFVLILAFVIIIAYQNFLAADANVSREASALASLVRDSEAFPDPGGMNVRSAVGNYIRSVVGDEWPQMHQGRDSALAASELDNIFAAMRTVRPRSEVARSFFDDSVQQLNSAVDARRNRIQTAGGGLPWDIAALIVFSSVVIVVYAVLVGSPSFWFHLLGPLAIAVVVIFSLVVLVDLSYPYSGEVAISSNPFTTGALSQFFQRP
jgi:hypothetical protein